MGLSSQCHRIKIFMGLLILGIGNVFVIGASADMPLGIQGNVTVTNTPLPVVVQTSARTPIQVKASRTCGGGSCQMVIMTVPVGKRLVVEYLSVNTRIKPDATPGVSGSITIFTAFDGQLQTIQVGNTTNSGPGSNTRDIFAGVVKIYAEAQADFRCDVHGPGFQLIEFINCTITGYLEDTP